MSGHTPGPWQVVNGTDVFTPLAARNGAGVRAHETDGWHIADCSMGETQTENGAQLIPVREQMANARLISAAPELLHALVKARDLLELICRIGAVDEPHEGSVGALARAAIAKATGGQP